MSNSRVIKRIIAATERLWGPVSRAKAKSGQAEKRISFPISISVETYFSDYVKLIGCLFSDILIASSEVDSSLLLELLLATLNVFQDTQSK